MVETEQILLEQETNPRLSSKEFNFLLYCSRIVIDQERLKSLVDTELNWCRIVNKAKIQGVAQFLYFHLSQNEEIWRNIPEDLKNELKQYYFRILASNFLIQRELAMIASLLKRNSINAIVLKGASLLGTVYKNAALRPMVDVDLLIKNKELGKTKLALQEIGYHKPKFLDQQSLEKFGGEIHLVKDDGVFLDIHSTLSQYERFISVFKMDSDGEIWTKSRKFDSGQVEMRILEPHHLVMHLCLHHAIAHSFAGLFRFCDLRETILAYQKELDWQYLFTKARQYKIKKVLYYCLTFTQELFGQIIPTDISEKLKLNKKQVFLSDCFISRKKILSLPDEELGSKKSVMQLFLMDNFLNLPEIIIKGLFPSTEWLKYRYGIHSKVNLVFYRLFHPLITVFNMLF